MEDYVWKPLWSEIRLAPLQLRFERPSDVLATWRRWRPEDDALLPRHVRDGGTSASGPRLHFLCSRYHWVKWGMGKKGCSGGEFITVDESFDDEAAAFVALGACLPEVAWVMHEMSPMLWVAEKGGFWGVSASLDFGSCVRKLSPKYRVGNPDSRSEDTPMGIRAAAVLERKLIDYLLAHRCTGTGPDDCLTLLDALQSLVPQSSRLPAVLDVLAPDFDGSSTPSIRPSTAEQRQADGNDRWELAQTARREVMRQALYFTQRLRVFAGLPDDRVPPGEPQATLVKLTPLTEELSQLDRVQGTSWPRPRLGHPWTFADPWGTAVAAASRSPLWDRALANLGAETVRQAGLRGACPASTIDADKMPPAYWRGYWVASLELGSDGCQPEGDTGWVSAYTAATSEDDPTMSGFAPLRRFLGDESRADAHLALVEPLIEKCPLAHDPWNICTWAGGAENRRWMESWLRRLPIPVARRFRKDSLEITGLDAESAELRFEVALALLWRREGSVRPDVQDALASLRAARGVPRVQARWWHPLSAVRALEMTGAVSGHPSVMEERMLLVFGGSAPPRLVRLLGSFGQYDEGRLVGLSDMDGDERLEAWFAGEWGECDGEDLVPSKDCAVTQYRLGGEVFGDRLGPYLVGSSPIPSAP